MKADFLYSTVLGRTLFKCLQKAGFFRLAAWFLHTKASRLLIPGYIKNNGLDMQPFAGQAYASFANFFARKRNDCQFEDNPDTLISPCDSLLSIYPVTEDMTIPMKGSLYTLTDLVPDEDVAPLFRGGEFMEIRVQAITTVFRIIKVLVGVLTDRPDLILRRDARHDRKIEPARAGRGERLAHREGEHAEGAAEDADHDYGEEHEGEDPPRRRPRLAVLRVIEVAAEDLHQLLPDQQLQHHSACR